ncbi:MAG: hypothetical protein FWG71_06635 [Synergistaceae bacterium]|nr:hypothetical protein [Synergistaceae bacterium]
MAAGCCAAAFFFNARGFAEASLTETLSVQGMPLWLESHVMRGLSAVWDEIPPGESRLDTLALVARRLFSGYEVTAEQRGRAPVVVFKAQNPTRWSVLLVSPDLRAPTDSWFARDAAGMAGDILAFLEGLPIDALSWADSALKRQIGDVVERRLPGWDFSLLARLESGGGENGSSTLQVAFHPKQPLLLAVTPTIFSSTLPVMFQSELTANLISGMSPVIGLPVEWISLHRSDVELLAQELLEDRSLVSNTRSRVEVAFVPGQVSKVDAAVNSERFIFQIWFAAYSGVSERYPEAGLLAGWNTRQYTGLDLEIYNETIIDVSEFGLSNRLGLRLKLWNRLQAGLEVEWPEQEVWYRAWWGPARVRRPYAWWRYSPEYGHNAALGYRINEYLSVELHYDERYEDKIGLRGILLL